VYNTSNSGLPDNSILSIAIDVSGNKWIGTSGGLVKFDDTNWTLYNTSNSGLPYNSVSSIAIDGSGNKWMWTGVIPFGWGARGVLTKFDGTNWTVYDKSDSDLPDNVINSIVIDESGNKWIGTGSGGLAVYREGGPVAVKENQVQAGLPRCFMLESNYPNPFNPVTVISWRLPVSSRVELTIYNTLGQKISTLVSEKQSAGKHNVEWNAQGLPSGVYICCLGTETEFMARKVTLLK
jgi:hypothetical protein